LKVLLRKTEREREKAGNLRARRWEEIENNVNGNDNDDDIETIHERSTCSIVFCARESFKADFGVLFFF